MSHATLRAADSTGCASLPNYQEEMASLEEELRQAVLSAACAQLGEASHMLREARRDFDKASTDLADRQRVAEDDAVMEEIDEARARKNDAQSRLNEGYARLSRVLADGIARDSLWQDAVLTALKQQPGIESMGTWWSRKLFAAAEVCFSKPHEARPFLDDLIWESAGQPESQGLLSAASHLAANLASQGYLKQLLPADLDLPKDMERKQFVVFVKRNLELRVRC
ncbi:unnamed protein product, partial [Effrenium voratum]